VSYDLFSCCESDKVVHVAPAFDMKSKDPRYCFARQNLMLVPHKNHKNPKKRIKDRTAVAYSSILKYIGVRVLSAF